MTKFDDNVSLILLTKWTCLFFFLYTSWFHVSFSFCFIDHPLHIVHGAQERSRTVCVELKSKVAVPTPLALVYQLITLMNRQVTALNLYNFCASNIDRVIYELDYDRFRSSFFRYRSRRRKIRKISITFPSSSSSPSPPRFYFPQNCIRFYKWK